MSWRRLALCAWSARALAQTPTGIPAVDSASAARAAWARAAKALGANDLSTARREVERASTAWPVQPAYAWARAALAARANDTATVVRALASYADLGLGRDLSADSMLAPFARLTQLAPIVRRMDANRAPLARSRVVASFSDSTFWPEGMDYDPRTTAFYVASVRHRSISEVVAGGTERLMWPGENRDLGAVLGVRVDTARGVLWVTTSTVRAVQDRESSGEAPAALLRVRIRDGVIERRWALAPRPGGHMLGDLAVGPRGDVFVTDSNEPAFYRLRPGVDTLERVTHPLFRSLQGVAATPDGRVLYLADYSHGLLRVDLATGAVARLPDAPHSTSLGCDGIALDRGSIIAVQNGVTPPRIVRFVLDRAGVRIVRVDLLDRNASIADEPTIGAVVGREFVYVANSQWDKHDDDGTRLPGTVLRAPVLLAVPIPR